MTKTSPADDPSSTPSTPSTLSPAHLRLKIRSGEHKGPTSGLCPGYIQANMVILPRSVADDFRLFCKLNHKPCPCLEVLEPGQYRPSVLVAAQEEADVRTDLPKYRVYKNGDFVGEVHDISEYWRDDLVTFFIGCSFSFEKALQENGISVRNIDEGKNVSMYQTNVSCQDAGVFRDVKMVVSMRPIEKSLIDLAARITGHFEHTHGAPVYSGWDFEKELGIKDLDLVDYGDAVTVRGRDQDVPMFTACGVTGIVSAIRAKSDICITHSPGCMFVSDQPEPLVDWDTVLRE